MAGSLMILNGPNLNLLGEREPEIYGRTTLAGIERSCQAFADVLGARLDFRQSNHEGVLVDWIQEAQHATDALIINPAGCSFYSVPILDALKIYGRPVIEVHVSNIHARDEAHRHSVISAAATAVICGAGAYGYILGMQAAMRMIDGIAQDLPDPIRIGPV